MTPWSLCVCVLFLAGCTSKADKTARAEMRDVLERIQSIVDGSDALPLAAPCIDYESKAERWRRAGSDAKKVQRYAELCSHDMPVKLVRRYIERADANPSLGMSATGCAQSLMALGAAAEASRRQERSLLSDVVRRCCGSPPDSTVATDDEVRQQCASVGQGPGTNAPKP